MLFDADVVDLALRSKVKPDDFHVAAHSILYSALCDMRGDGREIDVVLAADCLRSEGTLDKVGGMEFLREILDGTPTTAHAEEYIRVVRSLAHRRTLLAMSRSITERIVKEPDATAEGLSGELHESLQRTLMRYQDDYLPTADDLVTEVRLSMWREPDLFSTGLQDLDYKLDGGIEPGLMYVIGAWPSYGKTALCLNIAINAARMGHRVHFINTEMHPSKIAQRILAVVARVPLHKLTHADRLDHNDRTRLEKAAHAIQSLPLVIDTVGRVTPLEVVARMQQAAKAGTRLLVFDYLQRFVRDDNRLSEAAHYESAAYAMQSFAVNSGVALLVTSQFRREAQASRADRPHNGLLRGGQGIEQAADVIWLLHRPRPKKGQRGNWAIGKTPTEVLITKNKNGALGVAELSFDGPSTSFFDLAMEDGQSATKSSSRPW